jgi:hypothetical protein
VFSPNCWYILIQPLPCYPPCNIHYWCPKLLLFIQKSLGLVFIIEGDRWNRRQRSITTISSGERERGDIVNNQTALVTELPRQGKAVVVWTAKTWETWTELHRSTFFDLGTSWKLVISFTPRPIYPRYQLDRRLDGPQSWSGREENSWPHWDSNSNPLAVQPVASHYTDCIIIIIIIIIIISNISWIKVSHSILN